MQSPVRKRAYPEAKRLIGNVLKVNAETSSAHSEHRRQCQHVILWLGYATIKPSFISCTEQHACALPIGIVTTIDDHERTVRSGQLVRNGNAQVMPPDRMISERLYNEQSVAV